MNTDTANGRDAALDAAARGFRVFRCVPGAKRPAVADWEGRATSGPAAIKQWPSDANYGIACGPSALVVIDCDLPKPDESTPEGVGTGLDALHLAAAQAGGQVEWDTLVVQTPSGGTHLYYRMPEGMSIRNSASKLAWRVDVRGAGGYVVGPGSVIGGVPYEAVYTEPVAPLPAWLREALTPPPEPVPVFDGPVALYDQTRAARYAYAALMNCTQRVLDAQPGGRNEALNRETFGAICAGADPWQVRGMMLLAAEDIGLPADEARRTITSATRKALSGVRT